MWGDVYIDTASKDLPTTTKKYQNLLLSYGCQNIINKYTRICTDKNENTSKTSIDHMITNVNTNQVKSGILYVKVSDHLPIFGIFGLNPERQRLERVRRVYSAAGKTHYQNLISEYVENKSVNDICDPDKSLESLINVIKTSENRAFPLQKLSKKKA